MKCAVAYGIKNQQIRMQVQTTVVLAMRMLLLFLLLQHFNVSDLSHYFNKFSWNLIRISSYFSRFRSTICTVCYIRSTVCDISSTVCDIILLVCVTDCKISQYHRHFYYNKNNFSCIFVLSKFLLIINYYFVSFKFSVNLFSCYEMSNAYNISLKN